MPGVSMEQIARAREMDLLTYLETYEPQELRRDGPGRYTTATHGSLVISHGKWIWNREGIGGASALDYLIKVRGWGFVEAVEHLSGGRAVEDTHSRPKRAPPVPQKRAFVLPPALPVCLSGCGIPSGSGSQSGGNWPVHPGGGFVREPF